MVTWFLNFWTLNANNSKKVKDTDLKFYTWHPNFWALNADNSETVKAADFKFYTNVSGDSPGMTL